MGPVDRGSVGESSSRLDPSSCEVRVFAREHEALGGAGFKLACGRGEVCAHMQLPCASLHAHARAAAYVRACPGRCARDSECVPLRAVAMAYYSLSTLA